MSRDEALTRARALRDELVARGVPTSIEIQQGRPGTPNERWWDRRFIGSMGHHIVSRRSQGLTPGLALVKRGRSDVPGPLCNGYLGFDGRARIICMGWANHPGAGGPYTLPGGTIPRDVARPYLFGWEIEGGIVLADWPPAFRMLMGKCHAATLDWLGHDERSHIEHKTWAPTRKIDRLNYTLTSARAEVRANWNETPPPEDDMEITDDVPISPGSQPHLAGSKTLSVGGLLTYGGAGGFRYINDRAGLYGNQAKMLTELAAIKAAVNGSPIDMTALAQQVAALVVPAVIEEFEQVPGVTLEQVEAANERATRRVLGALDE